MENAINTLRIQNFKSIKDVTMNPRRVNLIIGMPNVGKSNILEAMSLLGGMFFDREGDKFMEGQIRYENMRNLFYDNNWKEKVKIDSNVGTCWLDKDSEGVLATYSNSELANLLGENFNTGQIDNYVNDYRDEVEKSESSLGIDNSYIVKYKNINAYSDYYPLSGISNVSFRNIYEGRNIIKKYTFIRKYEHGKNYYGSYLNPPYGDNLMEVVQAISLLRKEISELFVQYGLQIVLRIDDRKLEIQKNLDGFIYNYPYSLIADTLQRIIFYLAAIESNDDSVLLFEEPEAHTFPVYTSMLGRKIAESKNNQFFIATHSPYLVTEILEQLLPEEGKDGELAIFLAYYEDYQTKVKQLSDEEVREIRNDSIDVFYNLSRFTPGSNSYA